MEKSRSFPCARFSTCRDVFRAPSFPMVVTENRGRKVGLVVDRLVGQQQAFVKTLAFPLDRLGGVNGATILGNGEVVFIIDPQTLLEERPAPAGGKTMTFTHLTEGQLDALREISNIGMGHAATALSQLIGETVYLRVPRVTVTDIAQVPQLLGGAETVVAGITLQLLGDARGNILLIFPRESAQRLLSRLLGQPGEGAGHERTRRLHPQGGRQYPRLGLSQRPGQPAAHDPDPLGAPSGLRHGRGGGRLRPHRTESGGRPGADGGDRVSRRRPGPGADQGAFLSPSRPELPRHDSRTPWGEDA